MTAGAQGDPRDCGANRIATGHVFRLDWHGGERCWCHNIPLNEILWGRKSGHHTHPATHPAWLEFTDGDCIVCGNAR